MTSQIVQREMGVRVAKEAKEGLVAKEDMGECRGQVIQGWWVAVQV